MPRTSRKRASDDVIDLTGEPHQVGGQAKRAALSTSHASRRTHGPSSFNSTGIGGSSVYGSSPQSSLSAAGSSSRGPSQSSQSSQSTPASQGGSDDLEFLDLTQDDDGPPTEFYGSFGSQARAPAYSIAANAV